MMPPSLVESMCAPAPRTSSSTAAASTASTASPTCQDRVPGGWVERCVDSILSSRRIGLEGHADAEADVTSFPEDSRIVKRDPIQNAVAVRVLLECASRPPGLRVVDRVVVPGDVHVGVEGLTRTELLNVRLIQYVAGVEEQRHVLTPHLVVLVAVER